MDFYNYNIELPFCRKSIIFREIHTKEQIALAKANLSFPNDKENSFDYNDFLLNVILNCVKNKEDFKKLNLIDYVLFITKLRIISVGSTIDLITESKNKEFKKTKTTLDLNIFLKNLYRSSVFSIENNIIIDGNTEVKIGWPNMNSIKTFQDLIIKNKNQYEMFLESYYEFIEYIKIKDKKILLSEFDLNQKIKIVEKLPLSIIKKTQEFILESIKLLMNSDLWSISTFKEYNFNFFNLSFLDFIKLFFSNDLRVIYQEICFLSSQNLDTNYILNLSPMERKVHQSIVLEQLKEKNREQSPDFDNINMNTKRSELEELALEFGDTLS